MFVTFPPVSLYQIPPVTFDARELAYMRIEGDVAIITMAMIETRRQHSGSDPAEISIKRKKKDTRFLQMNLY